MGSSTWILSLKVLLISTGVVSIAMAMKFSVPVMVNFAVNEIPAIWSFFVSWLKPPYLYVIINCIIATIVASSRFHHKQSEPSVLETAPTHPDLPPVLPPVPIQPSFTALDAPLHHLVYQAAPPYTGSIELDSTVAIEQSFKVLENPVAYESEPTVLDVKPVTVNGSEVSVGENEEEFVISRSTWTPPQRLDSAEIQSEIFSPAREKPLLSSRFAHRKPAKTSPEIGGRALRVAKPKRQETLENTWRTITDGRHMPLTRHLKKSETFENHYLYGGRQMHAAAGDFSPPLQQVAVVKKAQTFMDRTNYDDGHHPLPSSAAGGSPLSSSPGSGKLRKEASLSQDELNRRVEAFIKKFNDEMRLQRQESLNQYMEMINRGAR